LHGVLLHAAFSRQRRSAHPAWVQLNHVQCIIQYVMPQDDKMLKKLLLIYWEIVPKHGTDGKLLHEMILVCDAYRKDLQHPNEFVRGCTLRFLCKLSEPELLEPLMPSIQATLSDKHQ
jgi:coatomer subunit beta